jgi:hypothetical protein
VRRVSIGAIPDQTPNDRTINNNARWYFINSLLSSCPAVLSKAEKKMAGHITDRGVVGKYLLPQFFQNVEHLLDLELEVDEHDLASTLLHGILGLDQHANSHAVDVIRELHVENNQIGILVEDGIDLFLENRLAGGINGSDRGHNENTQAFSLKAGNRT